MKYLASLYISGFFSSSCPLGFFYHTVSSSALGTLTFTFFFLQLCSLALSLFLSLSCSVSLHLLSLSLSHTLLRFSLPLIFFLLVSKTESLTYVLFHTVYALKRNRRFPSKSEIASYLWRILLHVLYALICITIFKMGKNFRNCQTRNIKEIVIH